MFILYLDELGHDGIWNPSDPHNSHHPLFGLAGIAIAGSRARDLDRRYLRLKVEFFREEIARSSDPKRPERYEAKQLQNRRDLRFAIATLGLVRELGGYVFVQAWEKRAGPERVDKGAVYGKTAQRLLGAFERFLKHKAGKNLGCGVIVMDRRDEVRDVQLLASAQSHLFSPAGQVSFERIVETPLLVRSEWYHGVQAADTVARAAGLVFRHEVCGVAPKLQKLVDALRPALHAVEYREGDWSSIYVHRRRPPAGPPPSKRPLTNPVLSPVVAERIAGTIKK